ncbi:MAG: hypothetical protein JO007_14850 [Alphaproteobacteria bacterium]|nr:hypothetical protein [Alphaproteobacteria bacterium]
MLAAWVIANEAHLGSCLVLYYEQHARHLASAEPTRYGLAKWCEVFAGALFRRSHLPANVNSSKRLAIRVEQRLYLPSARSGQAALSRARREGEIFAAPTISLALAPEGDPRERLLRLEEAKALFDAATEPYQTMYLMLTFGTAARPKAILDLTSFQIDCDGFRSIAMPPDPTRPASIHRTASKQEASPTLPICDTLLLYLRSPSLSSLSFPIFALFLWDRSCNTTEDPSGA